MSGYNAEPRSSYILPDNLIMKCNFVGPHAATPRLCSQVRYIRLQISDHLMNIKVNTDVVHAGLQYNQKVRRIRCCLDHPVDGKCHIDVVRNSDAEEYAVSLLYSTRENARNRTKLLCLPITVR